jgi:hypothetical protein
LLLLVGRGDEFNHRSPGSNGWEREKKKGREREVKQLKAPKARNGGLGVGAVLGRGEERMAWVFNGMQDNKCENLCLCLFI